MEKTREQKFENFTDVMTMVALRKVEFFNKVWKLLCDKIPEDFAEHQDEELKDAIQRIIANMSNKLFIGPEEATSKRINPKLKIEDLRIDQNKLIEEFYKSLKTQYPDLRLG